MSRFILGDCVQVMSRFNCTASTVVKLMNVEVTA